MIKINTPVSWPRMTTYAKLTHLVNTHQAQDFSEAGKILASLKPKKHMPLGVATAQATRLPYKDND